VLLESSAMTIKRTLLALTVFFALVDSGPAAAQIRTDGSLGHPAQSLNGPNYVIPQSLGLLSGQNLFQSFSTFNLSSGEAAYFTTSSSGIENIISRVTGGSASLLNGNINVFAASGAPNFFFINPAGVTFGNGATINVPAALHVSTASYVKFPDGRFYSDTAHVSTFSALSPEAFGFLGDSRAAITIADGAYLVQNNAPVSVVAGDIVVDDGAIGTFGTGDVRVAAVGMDVVEVPFSGALPPGHGNLQVTNGANIFTTATAQDGGNVLVSAGNVTVDSQGSPYFTGIYSDAPQGSTGNAGVVQIVASGALSLANGGAITATTESSGNVGGIFLSVAGPVTLSGQSAIYSTSSGSGSTGGLVLNSFGPLVMTGGSQIYSEAYASGNVGDVSISAAGISLDATGGPPFTGIYSYAYMGSGNAGNVDVFSSGNFALMNGASINGSTDTAGLGGNVNVSALGDLSITNSSKIVSNALSTGASGSVFVSAANISMNGITGIASNSAAAGSGPAGNVTVITPGALDMQNGASISSQTSSNFNSGAIKVDAGSVYISGGGAATGAVTGIASNALQYAGGNAGSIDMTVGGNITIRDGGSVTTDSGEAFGNSGAVQISAQSMTLDGTDFAAQISSDMLSLNKAGKGGNIDIDVSGPLLMLGDGSISADTYIYGGAGSVFVQAGNITMNGENLLSGASISTDSRSTFMNPNANAGDVVVQSSGTLSLIANGEITSSARQSDHAGSVTVSAANVDVTGFLSSIGAEALSGSALPGNVSITASNSISLSDFAEFSIAASSNVPDPHAISPTLLSLSAPDIRLSDDALISAISFGNVPASNILIKFGRDLILDPSAISTSAFNGNGGSITIEGGQLLELDHSQITTSVTGPSGNGGNINISSDVLLMDSGFIQANTAAAKATGGDVSINVGALVPSGSTLFIGGDTPFSFRPEVFAFNVIQAAAPTGVSGTIQISNPALDLSGSLSVLAGRLLEDTGLGRDRCHSTAGSSLALGGRGGLAPSAHELVLAGSAPQTPAVASLNDGRLTLAALSGDCAH
jgi:filamentous hemagglutinin family protein